MIFKTIIKQNEIQPRDFTLILIKTTEKGKME